MRTSRRAAALTVVGAVAAAMLTAGGSAVAVDVDLELGYTCALPSGEQPARVRITASLPDTAVVGDIVQPTGVTVTATLPPDAVADLVAIGAATVSGTADLQIAIDDSGTPADTVWSTAVATTPVPPDGELALPGAGDVAAALPFNPGVMIFTAGALGLFLSPQRDDGSSTDPPFVEVQCVLAPGQDGFLAAVFVEEGDTGPPPGTPEECGDIPPVEEGLATGCAFVDGRSNVAKLGASAEIPTALMNIALGNFEIQDGNLLVQRNRGELVGGAFPASRASFVAFGFVPISATMELIQEGGPIPVTLVAQGGPPFLYWIGVDARMTIRITDVTVNGVPLDVGPNCRSATPMEARLVGGTPDYTNIFFGGPLQGWATIPPFSGCGVGGDDLDPLLSGTVSGPGNFIRMLQGNICTPTDPWFCPPVAPAPPTEEPPTEEPPTEEPPTEEPPTEQPPAARGEDATSGG